MSKQADRDQFIATMTREAPTMPLSVVRILMRHSATLTRLAELACSSEAADRDRVPCPASRSRGGVGRCLCDYRTGPNGEEQHETVPRIAVQADRLEDRVTALCAPHGIKPVFSGDPRGAVVKLKLPSGRTDDWGGTGVCVP